MPGVGTVRFTFTPSTPFATAVSPSITPDTGSTNGGTVVAHIRKRFRCRRTVTVGGFLPTLSRS